jgi:hypothetical protein
LNNSLDNLFNIAAAIVALAVVAVIFKSSKTAAIIKATTGGFASSIQAAEHG